MRFRVHDGRLKQHDARQALSRRPGRGGIALAAALVACLALGGCGRSAEDLLAEVRLQQEIGSFDESIETLRKILADDPDNAEANLLLGTAQLRLGQPSLAIWPLEIAQRSPEHRVRATLSLGVAFQQLEQNGPALEAADRTLEDETADTESRKGAMRLKAVIHLQDKSFEEALADTERLLSEFPDDADALSLQSTALLELGRADEAITTLQQIWNSPVHAETAAGARAGMGLVRVYEYQMEEPEKADQQLRAVLDRFPGRQDVLKGALALYDKREEPERSEQVLQEEIEREPSNMWAVGELSQRYVDAGRDQEAVDVAQRAVDLLDTPNAWLTLSAVQRRVGHYDDALTALDTAHAMLPGISDYLRFRHADLLAEADQLDRADEVAAKIGEDFYREIVQARIEYARGNDERALELLESGLRRWPNNVGARYLAGRAALRLGRTERAVEELRESVRVGAGETDAGLDLARIYLATHRPEAAQRVLGSFVIREAKGERLAKAQVLAARALGEMDRRSDAIAALTRAITATRDPAQHRLLWLELASQRAAARGPGAGAVTLGEAKLDLLAVENESVLRAMAEYLVGGGQGQAALDSVDAAIDAHPDYAPYLDIRARVLVHLDRPEEAAAAFDRALELDPELGSALAGKATLTQMAGDLDRAIELYDAAAQADPANVEVRYAAAQIELARGRTDAAIAQLEDTLERSPLHAHASNDLAWLLAERGEDLDRALRLAKLAAAADRSAVVLDTLGWVQIKRDEADDAVLTLERAHALDPESPSIAYRLGVALAAVGEAERARTLWEEALASGPFPESAAAQSQLAQLQADRG
jgi:tetratricopeptide (TPR) repeat protein